MRGIRVEIDHSEVVACAGMSQQAAAKHLGIDGMTFNRAVHRFGIPHLFKRAEQTQPRQFYCDCCGELKPHKGNRRIFQDRLMYSVCFDCTHKYDTAQMTARCKGEA